MGLALSPRIVTDNLKLALDVANTKSFVAGTNIALKTDYSDKNYGVPYDIGGWGGDDADVYYYASGGYNNLPYKKMTKHTGGTGGSFIDEHGPFSVQNNRNYKISCWMKASANVSVSPLSLCINRLSDNTYFSQGTDITLTTEWTKKEWFWNSSQNATSTFLARHIVYNDAGLPLDVYWCDFKVEPIDYSIVDITATNTVTDYSLSYSSSNSFNFNGTNNYVAGTLPPLAAGSSSTIEAVVRLTNVTGTRAIFVHGRTGVAFNSGLVVVGGDVRFRNSTNDYAFSSPTTLLANNWYHLVLSSDATGTTGYCNGVSLGSTVQKLTTSALSEWVMGKRSTTSETELLTGAVPVLRVYQNKALTEAEVKRNFNALRGRYGI